MRLLQGRCNVIGRTFGGPINEITFYEFPSLHVYITCLYTKVSRRFARPKNDVERSDISKVKTHGVTFTPGPKPE